MKRLSLSMLILLFPVALFAQASAVIDGPDRVPAGDLIILDGSESLADDLSWVLVNSDKQFLVFERDTKLVFATGEPGEYIFFLAVSLSDAGGSRVSVAQHTVTVGNPPKPPSPDPDPGPEPPGPPPGPDLSGIAKECYDVCQTIDRKSGESAKLARAFRGVSDQASSEGWSMRRIVDQTRSVVQAEFSTQDMRDRWEPFNKWFFDATLGAQTSESLVELLQAAAAGVEALPVRAASDPSNETLRGKVDQIRGKLQTIEREVGP